MVESLVPAVDFSWLGRLGESVAAAQKERERFDMAKRLGPKLQAGDYQGASSLAFEAGDMRGGLDLLKVAEQRRQTLLGEQSARELGNYLGGGDMGAPGAAPRGGLSSLGSPVPSFVDQGAPSSGYIASLFKRESGGNPTARASTSSATGLGQFTDRTWAGVSAQHPELGLTPGGRTDPEQMTRATQAHTADNAELLRRSNLPVNDASLYALHFLGAGGGRRFLAGTMANPDRPAASLVSPDQAAANRTVFYDRSGRARTAGEVFGSFERSFGGGRAASTGGGSGALLAESEAGMMPTTSRPPAQYASLPGGDTPVQSMNPAVAQRPALVPSAKSDGRLSTATERAGGSMPIPSIGGADPSRVMTMPGAEPVQVAQAGAGQADASAMRSVQAIGASGQGSQQKVQALSRAIANPYLPEGPRELAKQLLGEELQRTRLPDNVKAYLWARGAGLTQARNLGEFEREGKGAQVVAPGSAVLSPDGQSIALQVPDRDTVGNQVAARQAAAAELGLAPNSPAYSSYVLTGKMPREDAQPLTASDKKAILEADDGVATAETVIANLQQAKAVSRKAYEGPTAGYRGMATGYFGSEAGLATTELDNLVTTNALTQLKAIFGAAPTEGERKILLDIQGSSSLPDAARQRIYDRGIALAERRLELNRQRASELRGQTYYKPDGGPQGSRSGAEQRTAPSSPTVPAPPAAIEHLRANPSLRGAFDQKYGSGAADRVLGGR